MRLLKVCIIIFKMWREINVFKMSREATQYMRILKVDIRKINIFKIPGGKGGKCVMECQGR